MSNTTIEELVAEERVFLHDLSNHLLIAQGMAEILKRSLDKKNPPLNPEEAERFGKMLRSMEQMNDAVRNRRTRVKQINDKPI